MVEYKLLGLDSGHIPMVLESRLRGVDFKEFGTIDLCGLDGRLKAGKFGILPSFHYTVTFLTHLILLWPIIFSS